jgi:hypothetical protein
MTNPADTVLVGANEWRVADAWPPKDAATEQIRERDESHAFVPSALKKSRKDFSTTL